MAAERFRHLAVPARRDGVVPEEGAAGSAPGAADREPLARHPRPRPGAAGRAEASWLPIARGLTPHGLRHSHKTMMDELRTPPKLKDERMGHEDGSVQARYSHITPDMRRDLLGGLTGMWEGRSTRADGWRRGRP